MYTMKSTSLRSSRMRTCILLLKNYITFLSKKLQKHGDNNLCNVAGIGATENPKLSLLYVLILWPYTRTSHHSHTDRTYSHHCRQQNAISLSSRLFHDIRVAVLGGVVV